jgi:hypothetical protein
MAKKENRGGKRAGSGRPRRELSNLEVDRLKAAIEAREKKENKDIHEVVLDLLYDEDNVQDAVRLGAYKVISSVMVIDESHRTEEKHVFKPVVLPERTNSEGKPEVDLEQLDKEVH